MKIRLGFVSNSSSSSYTCDVCGYNISGMDMGYSDAGMYSCINGHEFCASHAIEWDMSWEDKRKLLLASWSITKDKYLKHLVEASNSEEMLDRIIEEHDLEDYIEFDTYDVPAEICPLCSFGNIHERDAYLYLLRVAGRTEADLLAELKGRFGTYVEMKKWLKESQS